MSLTVAERIGTFGEAEGKESAVRLEIQVGVFKIQVRIGDLTKEQVDTIVNAANSSLDHAGALCLLFIDCLLMQWL